MRGFGDGTTYSGAGPYSHSLATAPVVPIHCPAAPSLTVTVTGRDVSLSWSSDANVARYGVERSSTGSWEKVTDQATGSGHDLTNHACGAHRFRVRALGNGTGYAPRWSGYSGEQPVTVSCDPTPTPTPTPTPISVGYQSDKTVKYQLGRMLSTWTPTPTPGASTPTTPTPTPPPYDDPATLIPPAIPAAVSRWNNKLQTRSLLTSLLICKGTGCGTKNSDTHIITVKVEDDHSSGCGLRGIACAGPASGAGNPLRAMGLVIEEQAWYTNEDGTVSRVYWTNIANLDGVRVNPQRRTPPIEWWAYIGGVVVHEFGHTLGLPDFWKFPELESIVAVMYENVRITPADLDLLDDIYRERSRREDSERCTG